MTLREQADILISASDILRHHDYKALATLTLTAMQEITGTARQTPSSEPIDKDKARWDAIAKYWAERRAIDAACTRSPMASEPSLLDWIGDTTACDRYTLHFSPDYGWFVVVKGEPVSAWSPFSKERAEAVLWAEQHAWGAEHAKLLEEEGIRF